jgi:hypothetical protein
VATSTFTCWTSIKELLRLSTVTFSKKKLQSTNVDAFHMYETGDSLVASGAVSADGKLLAVGSTDGYIYAFSDA